MLDKDYYRELKKPKEFKNMNVLFTKEYCEGIGIIYGVYFPDQDGVLQLENGLKTLKEAHEWARSWKDDFPIDTKDKA